LSPSIGLVAFDLDGTLVDSAPDIAWAVDRTLEAMDLPPLGYQQVLSLVGDGVSRLLKRALTGERQAEPDPKQLGRAMALFRRAYREHLCVESRLYPGAVELLQALQGRCRVACVTNKSSMFTGPLLVELGISRYFDLTVSGDTLPALKPDPRPLIYTAEKLGVAPGRSYMVGDSKNDMLAAKAAGFRALALSGGYRQGEDLMAFKPEAEFDSLAEVLPWLEGAGLAAAKASS
jgi:phosphoglycolate phosphatase